MGNTIGDADEYQEIEKPTVDSILLKDFRDYDCVMVFEVGSKEKDWKVPDDGSEIQWEYLKLLETEDIESRKKLFPQHGADFASQRTKEKDFFKHERKLVIKALEKQKIAVKHVDCMKEIEKDNNIKFYYLGMNEEACRRFAAIIDYELELDYLAAISYLSLQDEPLAKACLSESDDAHDCLEQHWHSIYVKFDKYVAPEIYKPYNVLGSTDQKDGFEDSLFRIRDKLALINECVSQDFDFGGCGIFVPQLALQDHPLIHFYPLHTLEHLELILGELFSYRSLTVGVLKLPLASIRSYFGEYIAIYFAFLQFMTWYLVPIVIIGFIFGCIQVTEGHTLVDGISYFSLIVILWAICFPVIWKRREFEWALKWGTLRFDTNERPRPEFNGEYKKSSINGNQTEFFPETVRVQRRTVTFGIVGTFLLALFGSVACIILLRVYVAETGISYGTYMISIANALVIMVFNNIYGIFAEKLNQWENYKTETQYENNLIVKVFLFRFINSYATLYYMAFFRVYEDKSSSLYCSPDVCYAELEYQVATIFITQLTVSNAIELGSLLIGRLLGGGSELAVSYFTDVEKDRVWAEYASEVYERTFDDYCEILISLGYATLFVVAFPWAPIFAFLGNVVEARIDGYKLCKLTQRPFPRQADDVGTWQFAMEVMGWAILATNLVMICFTTDELDFGFLSLGSAYFNETVTAGLLFLMLLFAVCCLNNAISNQPREIVHHIERQDHIETAIKRVGNGIDRYLDGMNINTIKHWERWKAREVLDYLQHVLYRNRDDFMKLQAAFTKEFNGQFLAEADEHSLEKKLGIEDHIQKKFILNARRMLIDQVVQAEAGDKLMRDVEASLSQRNGNSLGTLRFEFTIDHLVEMADFFEDDLTGQSKRKLWKRVDKDESSLIERHEFTNFLYFSIVVYVRARHVGAQLPKKNDPIFVDRILKPLEKWLLHYKISPHGMTYHDFDKLFSIWLKEYVRENQSRASGTLKSKFTNSLLFDVGNEKEQLLQEHRTHQKDTNMERSNTKLTDMFGNELSDTGGDLSEIKEVRFGNDDPRSNWPQASIDWQLKLDAIAKTAMQTDMDIKKKIWKKFDKNKRDKVDSKKSLSRLLYSLIALHVKTEDRNDSPPKYNDLQPLLYSLCEQMSRNMLTDRDYITKAEFLSKMGLWLSVISKQYRNDDGASSTTN